MVFAPVVGRVLIKLPDELLDELELLDEELELLDEELELLDELELELDEELGLPVDELDELEELLLELDEDELGSTCPPPQPLIIDANNKDAVPSTTLFGTIDCDKKPIKAPVLSLYNCECPHISVTIGIPF